MNRMLTLVLSVMALAFGSVQAENRMIVRAFNEDTSVAFYLRYIGAQASATIEVDATGDLTASHGAASSETADTGVSTDGFIDVSAAAENTIGEVVDAFNASTTWEAWAADTLRSESSNGTLMLLAATSTDVQTPGGRGILLDSSDILAHGVVLSAHDKTRVFDQLDAGQSQIVGLNRVVCNYTGAGGTPELQVYQVHPSYTDAERDRSSETLIWRQGLAASASELTVDLNNQYLEVQAGDYLVVMMNGMTTLTDCDISVLGRVR